MRADDQEPEPAPGPVRPQRRSTDRVDPDRLFEGGGELGARMRVLDWSATPLGPIDGWPQSLKTCVRIVLTSQQPMFVWWGDELVNLYNDAYRSILGGKHPAAVGQPAATVWHEIWDQIGPRAQQAMRENKGTYDEALLLIMERHGYREETYYTFSYSPVPSDKGGTGGIICANTDATGRIIGGRRLALLRELASRTADARSWQEACALGATALATNARDLPFALLYILDRDRGTLALAGAAGVERGHRAAPERVSLQASSPWPFVEVLRTQKPQLVTDLGSSVGELPAGVWPISPTSAVAWPIGQAGQAGPTGVLIAGLNPFRPFDDDYRTFVSLVAGQVSASIANADAYEQERRRAEALAEIDRAKTAFFSNVSHEFRTPLTLMLGPQEDALRSAAGALAGEELRTVHRNTLRLLKLVNSLLDFSRIEAGRVQASYRPTDLAELTRDLASAFRSAIERGGVRFEVDCPPLPQPVHVDRDMWEKIVLNLLSNAFKFTFEGRIGVALRAAGDRAELEVSDSGVGISGADLPRVFERFHRIEGTRARTHEGSGIGLALVQDLVRLHGGTITAQSQLGAGSTFTVSVPFGSAHLAADRVAAAIAPVSTAVGVESFVEEALRWLPAPVAETAALGGAPAEGAFAPVGATAGARVLVVDDNADMRDYVARLARQHWTVETASDGAEALQMARDRPPDLVLTDVMMPNLDGFGLLRGLREDPRTAAVPVIMLSARAGEESRVEGLEAGADDYLVKPFGSRELLARIATHLQIARLRTAAELERQKLYALFEKAPVMVAVFEGVEHRIAVFNERAWEVFGKGGAKPVPGQPLTEAIPELRGSDALALVDGVFRTGAPQGVSELPVTLLAADGAPEEHMFTAFLRPVRAVDGAVIGVMAVGYEVTEEVRLRRKAAEASRAKDEFLAMLGHELRNPLSPIVASLHLMRMRGNESRELAIIERQVKHLGRLVDDLLDISRITRGKVELRKERLQLLQVVLRGLEMVAPLLEQRRQQVDCQVPAAGLAVEGDAQRLAQVVSNLLTNAAKYSEPGAKIHVAAEAASGGGTVTLRVRDQGIGIAPEMLERVFELFVQQPQALDRSKGGLGLGLAIVRSLVELHGGTVAAHSEGPGRGSEFVVTLPMARDEQRSQPGLSLEGLQLLQAHPRPDPERNRVLVVDDNDDAAESIAGILREFGYAVEIAHDGPAALGVAERFEPNVCLLDIGLPSMDGYELARRLRDSKRLPHDARILAITGYSQDVDRRRSEQAGFNAHLVKPISVETLTKVMAG